MTNNPPILFEDLVRKDLKGQASTLETERLSKSPDIWRNELLKMKLSCESQMVASNARRFQAHKDWVNKIVDRKEYLERIEEEKTWKCNSALFLQKIETKLQQIKVDMNHE